MKITFIFNLMGILVSCHLILLQCETFNGTDLQKSQSNLCSLPGAATNSTKYPECLETKPYKGKAQSRRANVSSSGSADGEKVGGGMDSPNYIPYQISIQIPGRRGKMVHICGGSIYSSTRNAKTFNKIITAAHCFPGGDDGKTIVVAGIKALNEKSSSRQESAVCKVIVHETYDDVNFYDDIALLTLSTPLRRIKGKVEPIRLDPVWSVDLADTAQISGWGDKFETGTTPNNLQVATIQLEDCDDDSAGGKQVCAGGGDGPDVCEGDSGGPLVCYNKHNSADYYLCGLVSNGETCRVPPPHSVGIYTNVTYYIPWIQRNQNQNCI